jgi:5-methylcytosine-specific restriction endonuclease McrA
MARHPAYFEAVHYTLYQRLTDDERRDLNAMLDAHYATSRHLERVKPGDVLWLLNIYHGRLYLLGRVKVAVVTQDALTAAELVNSEKPWRDAPWYAISDRRDVEPLRLIDITERASEIAHLDEATAGGSLLDVLRWRSLRALRPESAQLLNDLWSAYQDEAIAAQDFVQDYLELTEDDRAYTEGKLVLRTLQERQRNRALIRDAKLRHQQRDPQLACEVCGFSFLEAYGVPYIEAHHGVQLASFHGEQQTRVEDLHLLCANCHRMVHTRTPPLSVDELRHLLTKSKHLST